MDIEAFANAHPLGYVHLAYAVVVVVHLSFILWVASEWRKTPDVKKATESVKLSDSVVPRSHA